MKHISQTKTVLPVTLIVALMGSASVISINAISARAQSVAAPPDSTLCITAALNPTAPRVGDNTLDLTVSDASGKPLSGLKLKTSVAMTSMDMGTSHPNVRDMRNGHYQITVNFGMAGPWRVIIRLASAKTILDFDADSKAAWKSPSLSLTMPSARPATQTAPSSSSMSGMSMPMLGNTMAAAAPNTTEPTPPMQNMSGMAAETSKLPFPGYGPYGAPSGQSDDMAGMNMPGMKMGSSDTTKASMSDMKPLKMPQLQEQGVYVATGQENWKVRTGFGKNAGMVGMMSQMMVGGSGMEGMKMPAMKMAFDKKNYTEDPDDANTDTPASTGGTVNADNSPTQTAIAPSAPAFSSEPSKVPGILKITGTIGSPKSGDNTFTIMVIDAAGAPVFGAKITTSVAMTSMDMGTSHPAFQEIGGGKYQSTVNFGMSGLWRVIVRVTPPGGGQPQKKAFDFMAK